MKMFVSRLSAAIVVSALSLGTGLNALRVSAEDKQTIREETREVCEILTQADKKESLTPAKLYKISSSVVDTYLFKKYTSAKGKDRRFDKRDDARAYYSSDELMGTFQKDISEVCSQARTGDREFANLVMNDDFADKAFWMVGAYYITKKAGARLDESLGSILSGSSVEEKEKMKLRSGIKIGLEQIGLENFSAKKSSSGVFGISNKMLIGLAGIAGILAYLKRDTIRGWIGEKKDGEPGPVS